MSKYSSSKNIVSPRVGSRDSTPRETAVCAGGERKGRVSGKRPPTLAVIIHHTVRSVTPRQNARQTLLSTMRMRSPRSCVASHSQACKWCCTRANAGVTGVRLYPVELRGMGDSSAKVSKGKSSALLQSLASPEQEKIEPKQTDH